MHNTLEHSPTCQYIGSTDHNVLKPTCTHASLKGRSYCTEHIWLVYKEGSAQHRKKDGRRYQQIRQLEALFEEACLELEEEGFL